MRVTKIIRPFALGDTAALGSGGGILDSSGADGTFPGSGQVPTSSGSNTWAWGSNVARITSNTSNSILGPFVNFNSGAGIALSASSNTITISTTSSGALPVYNLKTDFGAACNNATDDQTAWNNAITQMTADGGGICLVPDMSYISGTLTLPDVDYGDSQAITIAFVGTWSPPAVPSVIGATPLTTYGPGIRSGKASGAGAIFSGTSAGGLDSFTNVNLVLRNLVVRTVSNPTIHAIDLGTVANCELENVQIDAGSLDVAAISLQTTSTSYGLILPKVNNGAKVRLRDVNVIGFYNGVKVGEHADLDGVFVWASRKPWVFAGSWHAAHLNRCGWYHCIQGMEFIAGPYTNPFYFTWTHLNIERANSGTWVQTGYDVVDTSNYGNGRVEWHAVQASVGVVHTFTKNGGSTVYTLEIGSDPFAASGFVSPLTTKGDLHSYSTTDARHAVGSNGTVLLSDSTQAVGLRWSYNAPSGELLISDTPAGSPLVFGDVLQNELQDDLLYGDL